MRRVIAIAAAGLVALAGAAAWVAVRHAGAGDLARNVSAATPCTPQQPCEIRILFAYTAEGARAMQPRLSFERRGLEPCLAEHPGAYCVMRKAAGDNMAGLRHAFAVSGITRTEGGRASVVFADPVVLEKPIDGGALRLDIPANHGDPVSFNRSLLSWLPEARGLRGHARKVNIAVVFSGMRGSAGECYANALAGSGYVIIPGCLLRGYTADERLAWGHQIMFLHEVGHLFGAFHNDNGNPQPCGMARSMGKDLRSCAWEQSTAPAPVKGEDLKFAKEAFCTLVGQYNFNTGPTGESYCRAHTAGERGSGWIREFSHPGKCRTPGYEAWDCGDATHNAAVVVAERTRAVSLMRPRTG